VATRLAAGRLREAGIGLEPLLRRVGLSLSQINKKDVRIGVASQIMFLELAAQALKDPLLGFRLARDGDLRQMGLPYYAAASSETLGEALGRAQRYSSIVNAGVVLNCFQAGNFTIALRYFGVARHSDRQQMELLATTLPSRSKVRRWSRVDRVWRGPHPYARSRIPAGRPRSWRCK